MANGNAVDVGPWGGGGGDFWEVHGDIRKILISYGAVVDSLIITYIKHGVVQKSIRFGGPGGDNKPPEIVLADGEFLVTIEGVLNNIQGILVVASLTFVTNRRKIGPFGPQSGGTRFSLPVNNGKSAGLFGRAGSYLDAIGISLVPLGQGAVELGPWGGGGGSPWTYDVEVRSFRVAYDEGVIVSITLNGSTFGGASGGTPSPLVTLGSDEYLRYIKGATGQHENVASVVQTISFVSNKRTYGPYGKAAAGAIPFDPPVINGKIVGFSGRAGAWLDAIAFKVTPTSG